MKSYCRVLRYCRPRQKPLNLINGRRVVGFDVKFDDPTGPRIGAAFHLAAMSLDIEYQQLKYGSSTLERAGNFSANTRFDNVNLENNSWIVSLSFPLAM